MARRSVSAALLLAVALCAGLYRAQGVTSVVTEWLTVAQNSVLALGVEHQQAARVYGIVATAQYDAIKWARNFKQARIPEEAAAAYASHSALSHLFNWRQTPVYDPALSRQLAAISGWNDTLLPVLRDNLVKRVQRILTTRLSDGASVYAAFTPFSNSTANFGKYQFTPGQTTARYPQVANALGFYLTRNDISNFTAPFKAFNLSDPQYAKDLEQVYRLGSINSTERSEYDTNSPRFWALGTGTGTIAGVWLNISISVIPDNTSLAHQARFFQLLTSSFWDAAIACWRTKYRELFWRPITAIRTQHGQPWYDPNWTPLLSTPAHPEYPSGHQCSTGAAVYVLESYLGKNTPVAVTSQGAPDVGTRQYPNFRAAGVESGNSRLYAGVHFNKSNVEALQLGYNIAQYIHSKYYRSVTFSGTA